MNELGAGLWTEALKVRRSRMPWLTALAGAMVPLVGGLFMVILRDPELARRNGLLATKAQLSAGTADWPTYWGLLAQAIAVGGFGLFGLVAIWVFGREYADRTADDLLALPTARATVVGAKFIVIALWAAAITALISLLGLGIGAAVRLPGYSAMRAAQAAARIAVTAGLTVALVTPLAWAASAGRGYLPAVGALCVLVVLAQLVAAAGWGGAFPWSVPALISGLAGPDAARVATGSYLLVLLTGVAGVAGTLAWWQYADHA